MPRLGRWLVVLAFILLTPFAAAGPTTAAASNPLDGMVLFSLKKTAPVIDGKLDDPCWQGAQTATGFMPLQKIAPAPADTRVMSCYDEHNLYFAARVQEPNLSALKVDPHTPSSGDCIELFLDPRNTRQAYYQFIIDSAGNVGAFHHGEMKFQGAARAGRGDNEWTVEISIPLSSLDSDLPKDNEQWAFNVGRERYTVSPRELSSWVALDAFNQPQKFGTLAFYSQQEVQAILSYWKNSNRSPLLGRAVVSGFDLFSASAAGPRLPELWTYDPYSVNREKNARWNVFGVLGDKKDNGYDSPQEKYPEFYNAAMGLNRALVHKSRLNDAFLQLHKALYLVRGLPVAQSTLDSSTELDQQSAAIDQELNRIYQQYGRAFNSDYDKAQLAGIDAKLKAVEERIAQAGGQVNSLLKSAAQSAGAMHSWEAPALSLAPGEHRCNADGADNRLSFAAMRFYGHEEVFRLLGDFDSANIDWNYIVPQSPKPGEYHYTLLDQHLAMLDRHGVMKKINFQTLFGSQYWSPFPAWLEEQTKTDPDMILVSQDGQHPPKTPADHNRAWHQGLNPNNPHVIAFMKDYLTHLIAHVRDRTHFVVTGWEDLNIIQVGEKAEMRSIGYNPTNKTAFRDYLQARYGSIQQLNQKWNAKYADFSAIEPPDDKFLKPAKEPSGLSYEFERWQRVNHAQYNAKQRQFIKQAAPKLPVVIDDSNFLIDMNGYYLFKENAADFYSFHSNPSNEKAMWASLRTLARHFDKKLAYHENYWEMYRNNHLADERLARRDVSRFFYNLYTGDIRLSTWWLRYSTSPIDYVVAYGGGVFGLDYDQTIYRWSTTELAPMFQRGRQIEKAIIGSRPILPETALIQPLTTVINLSSMGNTYRNSPPILSTLAIYNQWLDAWNIPTDFIPDEMVTDGKANLDDYQLLILPNAVYLTEPFVQKLLDWTRRGGTLVAVGPFALADEVGHELPNNLSPLKAILPGSRRTGQGGWDFDPGKKITGSQPQIISQPFGRGTVHYLNREVEAYRPDARQLAALRQIFTRAAKPPVSCKQDNLDLMLRQTDDGTHYLCIANRDVEKPTEAAVEMAGTVTSAVDVVIPGGFAVPVDVQGKQSIIHVRLDPGDFTLLRIDFK